MTTATNFFQIFSTLVTILTGIGWGLGVPEALQRVGVEITHLQIAFALSLIVAIGTTFQKQRQSAIRGDRKSQIQIGGRGNKQEMK